MQSGNPTLHILRRIFSIHFLMFWWWRAYTCFLSLHGSPSFRNNMKTTAVCCIVFSFIYDSLKHNQSIWKDMKEMIKAVVYVSFICLYIWYWLVIIHCYFSSRETIKHILYQKYKVSFQKYTQLRLVKGYWKYTLILEWLIKWFCRFLYNWIRKYVSYLLLTFKKIFRFSTVYKVDYISLLALTSIIKHITSSCQNYSDNGIIFFSKWDNAGKSLHEKTLLIYTLFTP